MDTDTARSAVADEIDEIVWDASRAANRLVDKGEARSRR